MDVCLRGAPAVGSREDIGTFQVIIAKPDKGDWKEQREAPQGTHTALGDTQGGMRAVRRWLALCDDL